MFVSVTRLRARSLASLPRIFWHAGRSARQAEQASGFLGGSTLIEKMKIFWTVTLWEDVAAMAAFRAASAHRTAMPRLAVLCDEASIAHWNQETTELPSWEEAHRRMVTEGRLSKVNRPSPDHLANRIPPPRSGRTQQSLKPRH